MQRKQYTCVQRECFSASKYYVISFPVSRAFILHAVSLLFCLFHDGTSIRICHFATATGASFQENFPSHHNKFTATCKLSQFISVWCDDLKCQCQLGSVSSEWHSFPLYSAYFRAVHQVFTNCVITASLPFYLQQQLLNVEKGNRIACIFCLFRWYSSAIQTLVRERFHLLT